MKITDLAHWTSYVWYLSEFPVRVSYVFWILFIAIYVLIGGYDTDQR